MSSKGQRIGAHVSAAGGVENAPGRALEMGAEVFQFFSRSPRGGGLTAISDEQARDFRAKCEEQGYESYIHTPYYINFASNNKKIYHGSINVVREELTRATHLGVEYVVTHMGSARERAALDMAVKGLRQIYQGSPKFTSRLLLEIAAGAGSVIGDTFEELSYLLDGLGRRDVHICLDTAHLFASGYDIRNAAAWDATLKQFDKIIGLGQLRLMHVNDSKVDLAGRRDRHEHLGHGFIGAEGFKAMLAHPQLQRVNFILETKHDKLLAEDIAFLKKHRR